MIQEGRFSDVLSESQIARMNGNKEGMNAGIAEGLRMAAQIVRIHTVKKLICNLPPDGYSLNGEILDKAKEIEESAE